MVSFFLICAMEHRLRRSSTMKSPMFLLLVLATIGTAAGQVTGTAAGGTLTQTAAGGSQSAADTSQTVGTNTGAAGTSSGTPTTNTATTPKATTTNSAPRTSEQYLVCYQCASSKDFDENLCRNDRQGLLNTSIGISDFYTKNCTDSKLAWKYCMIQTIEKNGKLTLYHRGCHSGENFTLDNDRFHNIKPNNFTTCAQVVDALVCLRFCARNYCNGPQPPTRPVNCSQALTMDAYDRERFNMTGCDAPGIHLAKGFITLNILGGLITSLLTVIWLLETGQ